MRILVYGAGPLGSLFAARLHDAGHEVRLLARGRRLDELREHGVVLAHGYTGPHTTTHVPLVERLDADDPYDLVLVVMRKNHALQILPTLAANRRVATVLFLMNNFAGPAPLVSALGSRRVMLGFPAAGGVREGHLVRVIPESRIPWTSPIGEPDGRIDARTRAVAAALASMRGHRVEIRSDIDAWLKCHVALLIPALVPALYACGGDAARLARTRDALVLAVRGIREAFGVLRNARVPLTPRALRAIEWLPEPLLVQALRRLVASPTMKISGEGHARAARDEMQLLAGEFLAFAHITGARTPVIDRLNRHYDMAQSGFADGSRDIGLHWGGTAALAAAVAAGILLAAKRSRKR